MNRWTYIGICIKLIESCQKPGKDVVPFKSQRAQFLTVREQNVDQHGRGIGYHDELHHFFEGFCVEQQSVDMDSNQKNKPEQVGNQKVFAKWNRVIPGAVDWEIAPPNP